MRIRIATSQDRNDIREVYLSAFPENEREIVSKLAINLLSEETTPQTISLVAEIEGAVVGQVSFSPVTIDKNVNLLGYILAPLGVKPDYQKRLIGSKLIEDGMKKLKKAGVNILFVYGDPEYYNRFGFSADAACRYIAPYKLQTPFGWQATVLNKFSTAESTVKLTCVTSLCDPELW